MIASMLSSFYGWELFNFHQQFRVSAKGKKSVASCTERPQEKGDFTHV